MAGEEYMTGLSQPNQAGHRPSGVTLNMAKCHLYQSQAVPLWSELVSHSLHTLANPESALLPSSLCLPLSSGPRQPDPSPFPQIPV